MPGLAEFAACDDNVTEWGIQKGPAVKGGSKQPTMESGMEEEFTYIRKKAEVPKDNMSFHQFKEQRASKRRKRKKVVEICQAVEAAEPVNRGPYEASCWLCRMSGAAKDGTATGLGRFYRMFTDNYRNCKDEELYIQLYQMFNREVKGPLKEQGLEVPDLDVEDIRDHFTEHAFEPTVWVSEEIKFLKEVTRTMQDNVFESDQATKKIDVNDKRVWNYMKVQKQIVELYQLRLQNMNFYDVTTAVYRG
tara:strand:- start:1333 stop:2076 length:744 start_codon:yes stop_codon:yes gene_type:complete